MQYSVTAALYCYAQALLLEKSRYGHCDAKYGCELAASVNRLTTIPLVNCALPAQKLLLVVEKTNSEGKLKGPLAPEVFLEVRTRDLDGPQTALRVKLIPNNITQVWTRQDSWSAGRTFFEMLRIC
jgi:hypothetical protein